MDDRRDWEPDLDRRPRRWILDRLLLLDRFLALASRRNLLLERDRLDLLSGLRDRLRQRLEEDRDLRLLSGRRDFDLLRRRLDLVELLLDLRPRSRLFLDLDRLRSFEGLLKRWRERERDRSTGELLPSAKQIE